MKQYFEFEDDKSSKFWEVEHTGTSVTTRYGKIGADGTSSTKEYPTEEKAEAEAQKLIKSKLAKGYEPVGGSDQDDEDGDDSDLFYEKYHPEITEQVSIAVEKAIRTMQKKKDSLPEHTNIDVEMDWASGLINFWIVEEYEGYETVIDNEDALLFSHKVKGNLMSKCYDLMERMEEEGSTSYSHALSNFFEDAGLSSIDEKLLKGLSFTLDVYDVGGDPYMEIFNKE